MLMPRYVCRQVSDAWWHSARHARHDDSRHSRVRRWLSQQAQCVWRVRDFRCDTSACVSVEMNESEVTKLQTGGPDGDLGSNEILVSHDKTIAIIDGSGVLCDRR